MRSTYTILFKKKVAKDLKILPEEVTAQALDIIYQQIALNPFIGKPLKGKYQGMYRFRIKEYRIIYTIKKSTVTVLILRISHRKSAYRGLVF